MKAKGEVMKNFFVIIASLVLTTTTPALAEQVPRFENFSVTPQATATVMPDFNGRDKDFRNLRTRLSDGIRSGPNFSGSFTVITIGCGASCRLNFVANNKTGEILNFPISGERYLDNQLLYKSNSRLIISQYKGQKHCIRDFFSFDGTNFVKLGSMKLYSASYGYCTEGWSDLENKSDQASAFEANSPQTEQDRSYYTPILRKEFQSLPSSERRKIQQLLAWAGLYSDRIDGAWGPNTRRAMVDAVYAMELEFDTQFDLMSRNGVRATLRRFLNGDFYRYITGETEECDGC